MSIKTSLTEELILGLLAEQPRHGYQIEKLIEDRGMRRWTVRSRKKKPQKKDSILYAKRDADTASLFWLCTLLHTFLTQILEDSAASVSAAIASATE